MALIMINCSDEIGVIVGNDNDNDNDDNSDVD